MAIRLPRRWFSATIKNIAPIVPIRYIDCHWGAQPMASSTIHHANSGTYYYGYRFYDPSLQRWLNSDPIGETGGLNLFCFVRNCAVSQRDPLGLRLWVCTRPTEDWYFPGNHAYFWSGDRDNGTPCGKEGSCGKGGTSNDHDTGPNGADQKCTELDVTEEQEAAVMQCCQDHGNDNTFCPFLNDCHNTINRCLKQNGIEPPSHPRFPPIPPGSWPGKR